ncbi:MAG: protease modulator HflC [Alphaproteobacteria bacterium]|nr:protease modulator HflC [Alphaproteobacteria bacterium]
MRWSSSATVTAILLAVLVVFAMSSLFTVQQTQQALVLQFGEPRGVISTPGLHVKMPFIQNVVYIDKRILQVDGAAAAVQASDAKRLVVDAFMRYRIVDPLLYYQSVRTQHTAEARLQTILDSTLRLTLGRVPLISIVSEQRSAVMAEATRITSEQARQFGIQVVDVRIKRTDLPEENTQAIYARMRTDREREAREYRAQGAEEALRVRAGADRERTVLIAEAQRTSEILRGEGDAQAVKIYADAFGRDIDFFSFYRSMQAYREALPINTTMVLAPDSEFFRYFRSMLGLDPPAEAAAPGAAAVAR